ncbi:hypothetical protein K3495_g3459 [Podosphaera aphanis]|nr:hypothetical protein K3495_g3459 [Podosphaera aphanis]
METVNIALSKIHPGENREYIDSIKVYLRTAMANFGRTGLGTIAPMFPPPRPAHPPFVNPTLFEHRNAVAMTPANTGPSWAAIIQRGQHRTPISTRLVAALLQAQKSEKSSLASPKDNRLFLRLAEGYKWREISPAGIREALVGLLKFAPSEVGLVQRVRTGFTITARNEEIRKKLLASSEEITCILRGTYSHRSKTRALLKSSGHPYSHGTSSHRHTRWKSTHNRGDGRRGNRKSDQLAPYKG